MKKFALCVITVFAFALMMVAQDTGSQASGTSSQTATTKSHNGMNMGANKAGGNTLTGCLEKGTEDNTYLLKNSRHKNGVEVGGNDELSKHVGHRVELTGTWSTAEGIGEKAESGAGAAKEKNERHFKVESIKHMSDTCNTGASMSSDMNMGKKSKKGAAATTPPPQL